MIRILLFNVSVSVFLTLLASACATTEDTSHLSTRGEDVPSLEAHLAAGKVTVFDFYGEWCGPCREVDGYLGGLLAKRSDIAYRKINIGDWDTPVARRYLRGVPTLPYVIVYSRSGKRVEAISGLDVEAIGRAIAAGAAD